MFDQLFETFRKASETSLQMQQDMFKNWTQQWIATRPQASGLATEWGQAFQKRFMALAIDILNKHRETLDSNYRTGIQVIEQAFHTAEAKSAEDYRRMIEDLWRKLFEAFKEQSETNFRDFRTLTEKSFETMTNAKA